MDFWFIPQNNFCDEKTANKGLAIVLGSMIIPWGIFFSLCFGPIPLLLSIGLTWAVYKLILKIK